MQVLKKAAMLSLAYCLLFTQAFAVGYNFIETADYESSSKSDNTAMIKKVFDSYRYRMTVEWDQNDSTFKAFAKSEFEKEMLALMSQGISAQEIQAYMSTSMLDAKTKAEYEALVETMKKQGKSEEEVAQATTKFMEKNYNVGASYSSGASRGWGVAALIIAVVVVVVVTVIIVRHRDDNDDPQRDPCDGPVLDAVKGFGRGDCCDIFPQKGRWNPCNY